VNLVRLTLSPVLAEVAAMLHSRSGLHEHWNERAFSELLEMPGTTGELALADAGPVGLILWRVAADEAEILTVCVLPEARRAGVGRFLLEGALAQAEAGGVRRLILEAAEDNEAALALYRRLGFRQEGRRRGYYQVESGATDALILIKHP